MTRSREVAAILVGLSGAAILLAFWSLGQLWNANSAAAQNPTGSLRAGTNDFPNVPLVTHEGQTVRFYDDLINNKKVLINFIYTECRDVCPLATAKLAQVQKLLGPRVGRDIFIYSITLDPEHDTPEVLQAYAERYGVGPGWLFLTGERQDIDAVRFKLGERGETQEHQNIVRLGNGATGQWMKLPLMGDLSLLVTEIGKTFDPNWYASKPAKSYAEAPQLRAPEQGESVFRNKCAACHTLGKGDRLGPDLLGVTARRDRTWLARFIAAPDQVRASKDPAAVALHAPYDKVVMPNLGLTRTEVADLISFLEARTAAPEGIVE